MKTKSTTLAVRALVACSCGGQSITGSAADASLEAVDASSGSPPVDGGDRPAPFVDSGGELHDDAATPDCTYGGGGSVLDAGARFRGSCLGGCPAGTVCAVEIGGVAGGGGEYCAPILDRCTSDVSCACLASCLCGVKYGRAERCTDEKVDGGEVLLCDDGIR